MFHGSVFMNIAILLLTIQTIIITKPRGVVNALENGLARAPPMGWNSWNTFHCHVDQDLIVHTAEQIKSFKLDELGYRYVNIDDCWMSMIRTKQGMLIGDAKRFPKGMKWMGDYLHNQGLLFGIYSSAGRRTCAGYPASLGHERMDAQTFADWGVDFLKYDNCYNEQQPSILRYAAMRNALNATGRPILYSICQWGTEDSWQWASSFGNMWRTTGDIKPNWSSIVGCFWHSQRHFEQSRPGAWLDPDMLEVGNGDLSWEENKSHFTLWALAKAPLLLGNDLSKMTPEILTIISNTELIEIHQDPDTPQMTCHVGCDKTNWCAPNVDGEHIIQESDFYICNLTAVVAAAATSTRDDIRLEDYSDDYSIFATLRRGKRDGEKDDVGSSIVVVALIINWHDTQTLHLSTMNAVQILGIAPFPNQRVQIRDLWKHELVEKPKAVDDETQEPSKKKKTTTTTKKNLEDSVGDNDNGEDDSNNDSNLFTFDDLQRVPVPPVAPHDCLVYTFTTIGVGSTTTSTTTTMGNNKPVKATEL